MEFSFEVIEAEIGGEWKPLVLDMVPEDFDEVQFRAIGGQPIQGQTLSEPVHHPCLESAAGVDRSVVQDNQAEFFGLRGLCGESIQHGYDGRGGDRTGHHLEVALICGTEQSQHIQTSAGRTGNGAGLTLPLPGIRHDRCEAKTTLVKIKHVNHPVGMAVPEFFQARVRRAKGSFIAGAVNAPSAALPTIGFFLTIRRTV